MMAAVAGEAIINQEMTKHIAKMLRAFLEQAKSKLEKKDSQAEQ